MPCEYENISPKFFADFSFNIRLRNILQMSMHSTFNHSILCRPNSCYFLLHIENIHIRVLDIHLEIHKHKTKYISFRQQSFVSTNTSFKSYTSQSFFFRFFIFLEKIFSVVMSPEATNVYKHASYSPTLFTRKQIGQSNP